MAKIVNTSVEHLNKLMEALVDIATAAPVGPWTATESSGYNNPSVSTPDGPLFSTGNARQRSHSERAAAAIYVATFDPEMVILLLDIINQLVIER